MSSISSFSNLVTSNQDNSLEVMGITPDQALLDLCKSKEMIHTRIPEEQSQLETMYLRYANARKPAKGKKHDIAYRMQNLFMECRNL